MNRATHIGVVIIRNILLYACRERDDEEDFDEQAASVPRDEASLGLVMGEVPLRIFS